MAEYRLTPAAEGDLESIWNYTAGQWGIEQADRYIDFLTEAFAELADTPKIAPSCEHIRPGYRRLAVERHIIYFRVTDYGIAVIRVLHDRMDASRHL
ncbi:Toxin ParE1 [Thiorhodovibrio winogradskyi]|uniref:Toxin n=1 Tax=Thiorhodovibrio winogradskyi TaxID=77007 RepID=A0ABZ0S434_9GAMM|nr:type II toxin-antitoxin system RelE/ParE family toxin [Thiorhodovibrio winogradskyi]